VIEAVKKGRTDPRDFERWKTFHSSLKQALESWKVCLPLPCISQPIKIPCSESATWRCSTPAKQHYYILFYSLSIPPSTLAPLMFDHVQGADLGAIAASLSSSIGFLGEALERMSSSASLQYSLSGLSYFQRVYVAFAGNSHLCLSLLRHCADYGEKVFSWCSPSIASPTSSRVGAPHDLLEQTTGL
jgi:hypothetical protein